jgi:hypothetical protein
LDDEEEPASLGTLVRRSAGADLVVRVGFAVPVGFAGCAGAAGAAGFADTGVAGGDDRFDPLAWAWDAARD